MGNKAIAYPRHLLRPRWSRDRESLFPLGGLVGVSFVPWAWWVWGILGLGLALGGLLYDFLRGVRAGGRSPWWGRGLGLALGALSLALGHGLFPHPGTPGFGMPAVTITGVGGTLLEDARLDSRGMVVLPLRLERGWGEGRAADAWGLWEVRVRSCPDAPALLRLARTGTHWRVAVDGATFAHGWAGRVGAGRVTVDFQDLAMVAPGSGGLWEARKAVLAWLARGEAGTEGLWPGPEYGLWQALVLGKRDFVDPALGEAFLEAGCAHVLALSGMHLTLLSGVLGFLVLPLLGPRRGSMAILVMAAAFVGLAGPLASLWRALASFASMAVLAQALGKPSMVSAFAWSAPLCFMVDPALARDLGFWLSVGALGGILLLGPGLESVTKAWLRPGPAQALASGLAALAGTLPLSLAAGLAIRPQGMLATLVLAPLSGLYMATGAVDYGLGLGSPVSPLVYGFLAGLADFFARWS